MALNPLNDLKRRLEDSTTPLPKRLCLAKNVVQSHHFPAAIKERIIAEWLSTLTNQNELIGREFKSVLEWLNTGYDLSNELKVKLIQVTSQYLQKNPLQSDDIQHIVKFLDNDKISVQLSSQINDYLLIIVTLLQNLKSDDTSDAHLCQKIFENVIKYYKESKRKLEFIIKLLDGENLETVFSFLDTNRNSVINVCQNILFPVTKKSFFINFLQTLIVRDNIDDLIAEKGENIQSVIKIMSAFFTFPKGRTQKDPEFLKNFIDVFVSTYHNESQIIFAFYVMITNSLNMDQSYMNPAMKMPPIVFEENNEKIKRKLFLNMLEILLHNEVDVAVRMTDTFGEKVSKVEIKKTFASFLQAVMMSQLKLQGKLDKITLKIIKVSLLLDPILIEQKMQEILPPLLTAKKNNTNISSYTETLNCLLEMLFKLSRGIPFLNQILPSVKLNLEAGNTEQFELIQKLKESTDGSEIEKLNGKIIYGSDVLPIETIHLYGKLTSELMFRQNKELLLLLQKDLEENCLMMLEEGFVSPSIITLTELLSAILSSVFDHIKMADHTVPAQIAAEFWKAFQTFEDECLSKFGQCLLKLSYNSRLTKAFLKLCLSVAHMKLFNIKYSHTKVNLPDGMESSELFNLSVVLPCLNKENWLHLSNIIEEDEIVLVLDELLLTKSMYTELISKNRDTKEDNIKTHLIKRLTQNSTLLQSNYYPRVLFTNLKSSEYRQLSKSIVKMCFDQHMEVLEIDSLKDNKSLLSNIVIEVSKNLAKNFNNTELLTKSLSKSNFDTTMFVKEIDIQNYLQEITLNCEESKVIICIDMLKQSKIYYLEEKYQLTAILVLLLLKKCCQSKKIRRSIDTVLLNIFELSPKCPDIYKIFSVDFIFSFEDKMVLDILTLKIKTSNQNLILKCILELAVKKVKTDSDIVKNIVKLILKKKNKTSSVDFCKDSVFQISCLILPIIAKEKKAITASAFRSILADLQEKLHKNMLESFKNIDFSSNGSFFEQETGNTDDSMVVSESAAAAMTAMSAFSLTLAKYCESTDNEEIKNLDCLWGSLGFFVDNAIISIQDSNSKNQHIEASLQLIIAILRYIKKLETHTIFQNKDKLFLKIWNSLKLRIIIIYSQRDMKKSRINGNILDNIALVLKFVCELSSVECFVNDFVADLTSLSNLKKPSQIIKDENSTNAILPAHKTSKYLWTQCLKANIIGPKCLAMTKLMLQSCKNLHSFIQQHYEVDQCCRSENVKTTKMVENEMDIEKTVRQVKIEDSVCELLKIDSDTLSQAILAAKKITLDHKFLDAIFELQHLMHYILSSKNKIVHIEISWESFFSLYESCISVLNSLLNSREELLEDRWPNYMQCYRLLISSLCERASSNEQLDRLTEEKLGEIAHNVEKLTQAISKRRTHVSRIAAYTVADICYYLEKSVPPRNIRQHLENSVALLIQASDSSYAMAFLKRSLAGSPGQMTMTNMYSMYKRYHKYVGNA